MSASKRVDPMMYDIASSEWYSDALIGTYSPNENGDYIITFSIFSKYKKSESPLLDSYKSVIWHKNGLLHRDGGPAYKSEDGELSWWKDGVPHREDGPCSVYKDFNGRKKFHWALNGVIYSFEEYLEQVTQEAVENIIVNYLPEFGEED